MQKLGKPRFALNETPNHKKKTRYFIKPKVIGSDEMN